MRPSLTKAKYNINQVGVVIIMVVALVTLAIAFFCKKRRKDEGATLPKDVATSFY